jgi:hypothetical protein
MAASIVHRIFYWGGWSALVAIGTLGLAAVTYTLVRATKLLAQRAEADVRAQWTPVILARDRVPEHVKSHRRGVYYNDLALVVHVENVGRGPAFGVQAWVDDYAITPVSGSPYGAPEGHVQTSGLTGGRLDTAIAPGDVLAFEWKRVSFDTGGVVTGRFDYSDMSNVSYSTSFEVHYSPDKGTLLHRQNVGRAS